MSINNNKDNLIVNLPVLGMSCASCSASVESILSAKEGVISARVNLAESSVRIEFNPLKANLAGMKAALQELDFELIIEEDEDLGIKTAERKAHERLKKLKRNTFTSIILAIPLAIIQMAFMNQDWSTFTALILSTLILVFPGRSFFINAFKQARTGRSNMDTLVSLSTGVAWIYSAFVSFFADTLHNHEIKGHSYFEAAGMIVSFVLIGKYLEERAKLNTTKAIKQLQHLQPETCLKINPDGSESIVNTKFIRSGDTIRIKPGERIPVDGEVISGSSYVDESSMTGEAIAVYKSEKQSVTSGTLNKNGSLDIFVQKAGKETRLAQIIRFTQDAQGTKAPVQKMVDRVVAVFVPVVIGIAIISLLTWSLLGGTDGFTKGIVCFVTVLVVACPCALGLATPAAIMVGIGKGAEKGILVKNAESLELLSKINTLVFDKTGTLTLGKALVNKLLINPELNDTISLQIAVNSAERYSEHPLAQAILQYFNDRNIPVKPVSYFENIPGKGIKALIKNKSYLIGNKVLITENGIPIPEFISTAAIEAENEGNSLVYIAENNHCQALISISDQLNEHSLLAVKHLKESGIEVWMLSGDNENTSRSIAKKLNIEHVKAEALPIEKAEFIQELQKKGKRVAMVGDGINDSGALAQADVSIAIGQGADIAMNIAHITLTTGNLHKISEAISLSVETVKIIRQNLFWAFIYNLLALPLAAGLFFPFTGMLLNPAIASIAMALSSVSVVSNSLRIKIK